MKNIILKEIIKGTIILILTTIAKEAGKEIGKKIEEAMNKKK